MNTYKIGNNKQNKQKEIVTMVFIINKVFTVTFQISKKNVRSEIHFVRFQKVSESEKWKKRVKRKDLCCYRSNGKIYHI